METEGTNNTSTVAAIEHPTLETLQSPKPTENSTSTPKEKLSLESSLVKSSPRATRSSQNPDFAAKQRKFLNRVHDQAGRNNSDNESSQESTPVISRANRSKEGKTKLSLSDLKRKSERDTSLSKSAEVDDEESPKKKKTKEPTKVAGGVDSYCWQCHRDGTVIPCKICPRVYHLKCVQMEAPPTDRWVCPECSTIDHAENADTRSTSMKMLTVDQFCNLLKFALDRMVNYEGSEDFANPVDTKEFPHYQDFIVKPMDLSKLKKNIKEKQYGSTEAFTADARWMLHNSIIFNSVQSKFTNTAKALLKICKQEMQEIENCPDCYLNAHTRSSDSWFIEACRRPHILVWAKLKGFPFWPAKAMTCNNENMVDVRFFGAHDRAWVPLSSCFLYSKLSPAPSSNKNKKNLEDCIQELESHIKKLRDKFGQFEYPPYKTPYDPNNHDAQLSMFLPMYEATPRKKTVRMSLHRDGAKKSLAQRTLVKDLQSGASPPMVSFPGKAVKRSPIVTAPVPQPQRTGVVPLTAAAKKCFAQKGKMCSRCSSQSVVRFSSPGGDLLCSSCSADLDEEQTPLESKRVKLSGDTSSPTAVPRVILDQEKTPDCGGKGDGPHVGVSRDSSSEESGFKQPKSRAHSETTNASPNSGFPPIDSPPKFIISKSSVEDSSDLNNKSVSIVDKLLQDKLCYAVEEAIKDQIPIRDEGMESSGEKTDVSVENSVEANVDCSKAENTEEISEAASEVENDHCSSKKSKESESRELKEGTIAGLANSSESASEPDTDGSLVESELGAEKKESNKKKKETNINNVVRNLTERKNSVDERSDQSVDVSKSKESGVLMLDDSNDEGASLVIDESDIVSSDNKKSPSKPDKSRRKGIPAKVYSRSSSSNESPDKTSAGGGKKKAKDGKVVLDEVSGQLRRSSDDSDVTIVLGSNESVQEKKTAKEMRTVNISKSISMSVVNESSADLEMECIESDFEDQTLTNSKAKKVTPKPTARKTFPNPPRCIDISNQKEIGSSVNEIKTSNTESSKLLPTKSQNESQPQPPPLLNLRQQTKVFELNKTKSGNSVVTKSTVSKSPAGSKLQSVFGPANGQLDEATQKAENSIRSTLEDMLRQMAENGSTEAKLMISQIEHEKQQWRLRQELAELKHNTDLVVMEVRRTSEVEKQRALLEAKHKYEIEKEQAIQEVKRKQWCAFCLKESQLYCCWNTSYCSYECQQQHWLPHMPHCLNKQQHEGTNSLEGGARRMPIPHQYNGSPTAYYNN